MLRRHRRPHERGLRPALAAASLLLAACSAKDDGPYYGTTERPGGKALTTLYVNNGSEPEYLDPGKVNDSASGALCDSLFEGLLQYAPDASPVPAVAERWDVGGGNRLYRFHLRADARWSDGKPVTAHDFAYAWKRVLEPRTASRSASILHVLRNGEAFNRGQIRRARRDLPIRSAEAGDSPVAREVRAGTTLRVLEAKGGAAKVAPFEDLPTFQEGARAAAPAEVEAIGWVQEADLVADPDVVGVRATDDRTLEVELENPTPYFLDLCCHTTLAPVRRDVVEPFEARGEADLWTRPGSMVTNGPYVIEEHKFRYEITMARNPHHYDHDRLRVHRIVWLEVEELHSTLQLYRSGELDWLGQNSTLPQEYIPIVKSKRDYETVEFLGTYWYELNVEAPPLTDVRVRRALNLAIDKRQLVEKVTLAGQKPATHFVPDITGLGYAAAAKADRERGADPFPDPDREHDPAVARALLGEAGFPVVPDGDGFRCEGIPPIEILYNTSEGHKKIAVAIQDMWKRHLGITVSLRNEEWKVMLKNLRDGNFQVARMGWFADFNHPHTFLDNFLSYSPNNRTKWKDPALDEAMRAAAAEPDPSRSMALYRTAERLAVEGMSRIPLYFYTKNTMVKPWVKGFHFNARNQMLPRWMWIDPDWARSDDDSPAMPVPVAPPPGRF